jgi:hypothetical protein
VFGHGLSDEEKKNASDEFELHLELGNSRNVAVVPSHFIGFFVFPKQDYPSDSKVAEINTLRCQVHSDGN